VARIRSIKPEFPQSETVGRLSRDARLLFIQLWTIVDDEGRSRAASRMLASLLYPYDDDAPKLMSKWLAELEHGGCIRRYEVDGSQYLEIINWLKHQKIDKPSKSRLPPFVEGSESPREPSRTLATDLGPRSMDQDLGEDQVSRAVALASDWPPDWFEKFWSQYPKRVEKKKTQTILDRLRRGGGLPWATLNAGVMRYAAECTGKDPQFVKQPPTWLNAGCWDDEPQATFLNGRHHAKPTLADRALELADEARQLERAAGIGRPDDTLGSA
jgi:hypothetical protein